MIPAIDNYTIRAFAGGLYEGLKVQNREGEFSELFQLLLNRTQPKHGLPAKSAIQREPFGNIMSPFISGITSMDNCIVQTLHYLDAGGNKAIAAGVIVMATILINLGHLALDKLRRAATGKKINLSAKKLARELLYKIIELDAAGRLLTFVLREWSGDVSYGVGEIPMVRGLERFTYGAKKFAKGVKEHNQAKALVGGEQLLSGIDTTVIPFAKGGAYGLSGMFEIISMLQYGYITLEQGTPYFRIEKEDEQKEFEDYAWLMTTRAVNKMTPFWDALGEEKFDIKRFDIEK